MKKNKKSGFGKSRSSNLLIGQSMSPITTDKDASASTKLSDPRPSSKNNYDAASVNLSGDFNRQLKYSRDQPCSLQTSADVAYKMQCSVSSPDFSKQGIEVENEANDSSSLSLVDLQDLKKSIAT